MILEVVAAEAAKALAASASGVVLSGSGKLLQTLLRKVKLPHPTASQDHLRKMILTRAEHDPQFAADLAEALAATADDAASRVALLPPTGFVDRDDLRARIEQPSVWLIAGGPGVGKTALVAQVAADLADQYPAGQVYLDLDRYRDGNALLATEAKRAVLRQLGVDVLEVPAPDVDRQYVAALLHRRFILMIDNVVDRTEAAALAQPWPNALVLVTTRRLAADLEAWCPGTSVILQGLDEPGALQLLATRCGPEMLAAEPEAARELVRRCDWMPFAVEQVGVWLKRRDGESGAVADVLRELGPAAPGGGVIDQCLTRTFDLLTPAARRAAAALGLHPGWGVTRAAAAALLDEPAGPPLDELVEAGWAVRSPAGRFRLHRLVRSYVAQAGYADVDREAVFDRMLMFYLDRAVAADLAQGDRLRRYDHTGFAPWSVPGVDPIDWLDAEADVIADLIPQAHDRGRHVEVTQLTGPLEVLFTNRGRHWLCATANTYGISSASALGAPVLQARLHAMQARIFTALHLFDPATDALAEAERLLADADDPQLRSSMWEFAARLHEERVQYDATPDYGPAIAGLEASADIDRRTSDGVALGLHLRMLANLLVKTGRYVSALALVDEAGRLTRTGRNAARLDTVRAKAYAGLGQFPEARTHLERASALGELASATQYDVELAEIGADIAIRSGDTEAARAGLGRLADLHWRAGHPRLSRYLDQLNTLPAPPR